MTNFIHTIEKVNNEEVPHTYLIKAEGPNHFRSLLKSVKGSIQLISSPDDDLVVPEKIEKKMNIYVIVYSCDKNKTPYGIQMLANSMKEALNTSLDLMDKHPELNLESIELYTEGVEILS